MSIFKVLSAFAVLFFMNGCSVLYDDPVSQLFVIPKGKHHSVSQPTIISSKEIKASVMFDNTAIYKIDNEDSLDINKLIGIGSYLGHHNNSVRVGWRWSNKKKLIELFAYTYTDGVRDFFRITDVPINSVFDIHIDLRFDQGFIGVNGVKVRVAVTNRNAYNVSYMLYPYFGGDETAPQNINIYIKFN